MKSRDPDSQSTSDMDQFSAIAKLFEDEQVELIEKIEAFPKFCSRQTIAKFLSRYEIFKKVLHVNGSIFECGVLRGTGLFTWAKLSSIFEPSNHTRKIVGFDTYDGFPSVNEKDTKTGTYSGLKAGELKGSTLKHLQDAVRVYDLNRAINHIPKVELVAGDMMVEAERYLNDNPHTVVALLYLDFDLYEPTKKALEVFLPRMPRGAVIAFDELNTKVFPGETLAVLETIGIRNIRVERFPFDSYISYAILD